VKAQRDLATLPPSIQTSSAKKGNIDAILFDGVYKALKTENIQVFYIFIFPTSITFSVPSTLIVLIGNYLFLYCIVYFRSKNPVHYVQYFDSAS
jgi:hypothetical protein